MADAGRPPALLGSAEGDRRRAHADPGGSAAGWSADDSTLAREGTPSLGVRGPLHLRGEATLGLSSISAPPRSSQVARDGKGVPPPCGALLGGIYRVLQKLGEGAMGVILLARDEHLQRDVAIKLLRPEQLDNQAMQARLLEEARAMARVHHPNVVEIHAFGEHEGAPYFVMQYVPGATLDAYVTSRQGARLGLDEALGLLDPICLGVAALHAAGIAHRDLKPSNILVGEALRVVIADLGLARKFSQGDDSELSFSGTPAYLAPEIALGQKLDPALLPRVDVYALGLIAYLLLTGRFPFQARSAAELLKMRCYQTPPAPSELCPELPASFDAPLLAALAREPELRTESVEALREALLDARSAAPPSLDMGRDAAFAGPAAGVGRNAAFAGPAAGALRVLIADDHPAFQAFLAEVLAEALPGAVIETVPDGAAALAAAAARPPSLGVFDLDMPGLDGVALTAAIRGLPAGGDFPILVATGTGGAADWQRLSKLGASAFLVKPFDAGQLITLARGLVSVARRKKETAP